MARLGKVLALGIVVLASAPAFVSAMPPRNGDPPPKPHPTSHPPPHPTPAPTPTPHPTSTTTGIVVPPPPPSLARSQDEFDRDLTRPATGPLCLPLEKDDVERCLDGKRDDTYPTTCPADNSNDPHAIHSYNLQVVCDKVSEVHTDVHTAADVQAIVRSAVSRGKRVRAIGNQHSANTTLCTDGVVIDMKSFSHPPQPSDIQDFEGVKTVSVDPGVKLFDLSKFLDDNGWSLGFVNPGFRLPTMGGAIATGTHGSSPTHTAVVSNIVQSMTVVLADGSIKEFTKGTTGKTDPDLWRALTANNGFLGVVVKMRVKVEPRFNLKVVTKMYYKSEELLEKGPHALVGNCDWGQAVWFPVANQPWLGRVWTLCGTKTNEPRTPGAENQLLNPPLSFAKMGIPMLQSAACGRGAKSNMCELELLRTDNIRDVKGFEPFKTQSCSAGHCSDVVGAPYLMMSSDIKMGDILDPQGGFTQRDWEIAIPKQNALAALKDAYAHFTSEKICLPLIGVFIRFAPAEDETLIAHTVAAGEFHKGDAAMFFEMPVYLPTGMTCAQQARYEKPYEDIAQLMITKHGGRAHWGKNRRSAFILEKERNTYGDNMAKFRAVVARMDPKGVFANEFGVDMGLSWPQSSPIPADTASRACVENESTLPPLPPGGCAYGKERNGALCYPKCKAGYESVGCCLCRKMGCPPEYHDDGATCRRDPHAIGKDTYGRGAGYPLWDEHKCKKENPQGCEKNGLLWYPKCKEGYENVGCCLCRRKGCPAGYRDDGGTCFRDASIIGKETYGRGVGEPPIN